MKKNTKTISGIAGVLILVIILGYLGKNKLKEGIYGGQRPTPILPSAGVYCELVDLALIHHGQTHSSRNNKRERNKLLHANKDPKKAHLFRDEANQAAVAALIQISWETLAMDAERAVNRVETLFEERGMIEEWMLNNDFPVPPENALHFLNTKSAEEIGRLFNIIMRPIGDNFTKEQQKDAFFFALSHAT